MTAPAALDSDILKEAEQIRKERLSKRAAAGLSGSGGGVSAVGPGGSGGSGVSGVGGSGGAVGGVAARIRKPSFGDEKHVLVGNLIGEDHVNYVLMYNMLTGIRIAVRISSLVSLLRL